MAIFNDADVHRILAATGKSSLPERLDAVQEHFETVAAAYLEDRLAVRTLPTPSRVADKLSKVATAARSLKGTVSYGDETVNRRVREALVRAASRSGASAADVADVLANLARLGTWASAAHREVRDESKRPGTRHGGADEAIERLLGNLWDVWPAVFEGGSKVSSDSGFDTWVMAYVEQLLAKRPDLSELRRLSRENVSAWRHDRTPSVGRLVSLSARRS